MWLRLQLREQRVIRRSGLWNAAGCVSVLIRGRGGPVGLNPDPSLLELDETHRHLKKRLWNATGAPAKGSAAAARPRNNNKNKKPRTQHGWLWVCVSPWVFLLWLSDVADGKRVLIPGVWSLSPRNHLICSSFVPVFPGKKCTCAHITGGGLSHVHSLPRCLWAGVSLYVRWSHSAERLHCTRPGRGPANMLLSIQVQHYCSVLCWSCIYLHKYTVQLF